MKIIIPILVSLLVFNFAMIFIPNVQADPAAYTIQGLEPGDDESISSTDWSPGARFGWMGCDDVPVRLLTGYSAAESGPYTIHLEGQHLDTDGNHGIDYMLDFWYNDPDGILSNVKITYDATEVSLTEGTTYAVGTGGGAGTGEEVDNGGQVAKWIRYTLSYTVSTTETSDVGFYWKAHLALSPNGAAEWMAGENLQVSADPPTGGEKTLNIKRPEGGIEVSKTAEGTIYTEETILWTLDKQWESDPDPLILTKGDIGTITYTITVTKETLSAGTARVIGSISIKNTYKNDICVDVLDQVIKKTDGVPTDPISGPNLLGDETFNNVEVKQKQTKILSIDIDISPVPADGDDAYNVVWIGFNQNPSTCPTANADGADFSGDGDYDKILQAYDEFTFHESGGDGGIEEVFVYDDQSVKSGDIKINSVDFNPEQTDGFWYVEGSIVLQITKEVECTGPEDGVIENFVYALDDPDDGELVVRFPAEGAVIVNVDQVPEYPSPSVGGVMASSNKLAILAPYLAALIGLVSLTGAALVYKRRRKA